MLANAFRVLQDPKEILQARQVLHKVYMEELGWNPAPDNPSGLHVQQLASGDKMLCDHFDDDAVWIGTYKGQELAGVSRTLTRENKLGKLDVELYDSSKKLSNILKLKEPCLEIQRLATLKQYREEINALVGVLSFNLSFAKTRGMNIVAATSLKEVHRTMEKLGFECLDENFAYGEEDESPVSVYCLSYDKIDDAIKELEVIKYSLKTATQLPKDKWF